LLVEVNSVDKRVIIKLPSEIVCWQLTVLSRRELSTVDSFRGEVMPKTVLLVEDNPSNVRLTQEAFLSANNSIQVLVAYDGTAALVLLRQQGNYVQVPRPDLILLDLNLPKVDGREVLTLIKADDSLKAIPTVVLTTSEAEADITKNYQLQANCYLRKPRGLNEFERLVKYLNDFWLARVKLPHRSQAA
jgi:chemotaxis family two-component system response regulator Rcp1